MTRRRRRWHRIVIPFAVAAALIAGTVVLHSVDEPDFGDAGTLSPLGTAPDGSSRLAAMLSERGIPVERLTTSLDLVRAAQRGGPATIFVPAPNLVNRNLVWLLGSLRTAHRVVLVEPGPGDQVLLPFVRQGKRWSSRAVPPQCPVDLARSAGRAAALRSRYELFETGESCYDGGLVAAALGSVEVVAVGATDPFRNSRIGEHGNAGLAAGLLSGRPRVLWVDRHGAEKVSYSTITGDRIGFRLPEDVDEDEGGGGRGPAPPSPLWTAVPPALWPVLVELLAVAVLLALWRARRLGPPVPEPLPVAVPAAETVTGRGRLYERADARETALATLQSAARHRILPLLDLPPDAAEVDVAAAVAARTGRAPADVRTVLYGFEPADDDHLMMAVTALDALVAEVSRERTRQ